MSRPTVTELLDSGKLTPLNSNTAEGRSYAFTSEHLDQLRQQQLVRFSQKFKHLNLNEQRLILVTTKFAQVQEKVIQAEAAGTVKL